MVMPTVFSERERVLTNFDFIDIATGRGIRKLYGGQLSGATILSDTPFASTYITTNEQVGGAGSTWTEFGNNDYDLVFKRPLIIGSFEVTAKPASKLRRILYDAWPYWQGSQPKFTFYFRALTDIKHESNYVYDIQYSTGKISKIAPWQISIPPKNNGSTYEVTIRNNVYLINTGDAFVRVAEVIGAKTPLEYESVYSFHVTSRSWLALALLAGILAGGLSIVGSWLLN